MLWKSSVKDVFMALETDASSKSFMGGALSSSMAKLLSGSVVMDVSTGGNESLSGAKTRVC